MAQINSPWGKDEQIILREVLHTIVVNPDPSECVPPLLQTAQVVSGASGACFLIFYEPRLLITNGIDEAVLPDDDALKTLVSGLSDGVHHNPPLLREMIVTYADGLIAPIRVRQHVVGLLYLAFSAPAALTEQSHTLLMALVDGLTIVTMNARSQARHEKLSRNQSEFTRIVSHDLRSPLTSMQGFASMLESGMVGEMNEKQAYFVEKILAGIAQMTSLVENIQDAGRYDPETGFYEMERSQCDLIEMVNRIVGNHLVPAEKQELTISVEAADDVPIINADNNMLERALTNLVDNAIKYTPNGGHIRVGVERQDDAVLMRVSDNGFGISAEHQRHLFERHVRIPRREHKKVKGTGLGLFIVRSVAQRHGGDAWVESEEGSGSTFFIRIPLSGANLLVSEETGS